MGGEIEVDLVAYVRPNEYIIRLRLFCYPRFLFCLLAQECNPSFNAQRGQRRLAEDASMETTTKRGGYRDVCDFRL